MKPIVRIALPLAAAATLAGCGKSPEALYASAKTHYAQQDYNAARLELASALDKQPGNVGMLSLLVETHLRLGDPDGAQSALARLRAKGGTQAQIRRFGAELAMLKHQPEDALNLLGDDASPQAARLRAAAYIALKDDTKAVTAFEQGMAAGNDVDLQADYARFRLLRGETREAAKLYDRMRQLAPDSYDTLVLGGDLAAAQGKTDKAIAAYSTVIARFPDRTAPIIALANQYDNEGKIDKALALAEKADELSPGDRGILTLRMQLYAEKGEWEKIRQALQSQEATLEPGSGLGMTYAEALLRLGHAEQARILFARAALVLPGNPYAHLMLGISQIEVGDDKAAWKTLMPLAKSTLARPEVLKAASRAADSVGAPQAQELHARLDPAKLKAHMALVQQGQTALMQHDWPGALNAYRALLAEGEDPEVLKRMAFAASKTGDHAGAIAYADRALALGPDVPDYLYMAGKVRVDAGRDLKVAREYLERASREDPRNPEIAQALELAKAATG